jgi:Na+-driven multidrug efflux pump
MLRRTFPCSPWRAEAMATLLLAYPMVLTNLAQSLIHATDVVLLGRVGPNTLAAAALGVNLYIFCLIFGMGLMTAAAPMIARERGARPNSVRDVRRTVRQAMWSAVLLVLPMWAFLWNAEAVLILLGQDPVLAEGAQSFVRCLMWALLPSFLYSRAAQFPGGARAAALGAHGCGGGGDLQRRDQLCPDLRRTGDRAAAARAGRAGIGSAFTVSLDSSG